MKQKIKVKKSYLKDLAILAIIYCIYFFSFLGSRHLSVPDEGRYPEIAREMLSLGNWVTPLINGVPFLDKPPLYYWLEASSMLFFGVNSWAIRLPQALFGILGCGCIYLFGRYFYSRFVGLLASLILAANILYFFESHYANMDLIVGNLLWISFFLVLASLKQQLGTNSKRILMYAGYTTSALAFLTKGLIALVFPCMTIFMWMLITNNWRRLKELYMPTGMILFVAIISPWLILAQIQNPDFLYFFFYFQQFYRFVGKGFNNEFGPWFYFAILFVVFLPFSVLLVNRLSSGCRKIWQNRKEDYVTFLIFVWCVLILVFFSIPSSKIVSYILPIFGPLALLMAISIERIITNKDRIKAFKNMHILSTTIFAILSMIVLVFPLIQQPLLDMKIPLFKVLPVALGFLIVTFSLVLSLKNKLKLAVVSVISGMLLSNISALLVLPYFDKTTSQPLITKVLKYTSPDTIFVYYNKPQQRSTSMQHQHRSGYNQDLPLLLNKQVYIVYNWETYKPDVDNWAREFYYGINQYKQSHSGQWPKYLITYQQFNSLIKDNNNVVIFTDKNALKGLINSYPDKKYNIIGFYNQKAVLTISTGS